ncbi:MAG: 16S rRNA (cytosine(1402)-N(4))-methyltransferase RsmH, partial [Oscillospiraceae bacterium]|nr:16S rRNA (cytosine(1402)-N(4))-methyltransferase RsmH [Oscillospiraceae bacterium]
KAASLRLEGLKNAELIQGDFSEARELLRGKAERLDGALLDLGVSSHQLDSAERGFSYNKDGALDMRMSKEGPTAADLVNTLPVEELERIIRSFGEESCARVIAAKIAKVRSETPIESTAKLAETIVSALPPSVRRKEKNPARKTFQALRIAVNDELGALERGLEAIFSMLKSGGRLCVISFHSLEDRAVKQFFAEKARGCVCPPDFPVCVCGRIPEGRLVYKKPVCAEGGELEENRRARSAKLRVLEKL